MPVKNYERRKKFSNKSKFQKNTKGFAKRGIFGRGTHIEEDKFNYFKEILDNMDKIEDIEEKVIMANNVFATTKGSEVYLASNQIVCKALELLIALVHPEHLENYFAAFGDVLRPICSDPFASHVLQKLLETAFLRYVCKDQVKNDDECEPKLAKQRKIAPILLNEQTYNLETEFTKEHKTNCGNFVLRVGKFLLNNLEEFVWDTIGTHVMRSCILYLAGIHVAKEAFARYEYGMYINRNVYEVPSEWNDVSKEFAERIAMWPQFRELPYGNLSSALLGVLCTALKVIDKKMFKSFATRIFIESLNIKSASDEKKPEELQEENEQAETTDSNLPEVFKYRSSIVILETLIALVSPKLLGKIYTDLFTNRITQLAKVKETSFTIKKLIDNIKDKETFENIYIELHEHLEELMRIDHTAILVSLAKGCIRFQTKQSQLMMDLQTAFHLTGDKERLKYFLFCVLQLKPYETYDLKSTYINIYGSYLAQELLCFNKPIFFVKHILEFPPETLVSIFNTRNGSYVCETFLKSKFVGEKSRDKLIKNLEYFYVDLAINKSGSYLIELMFASAQDAQKIKIVKELSAKINMLKSTACGRIINAKLRVETYALSPAQWKASFEKSNSKEIL